MSYFLGDHYYDYDYYDDSYDYDDFYDYDYYPSNPQMSSYLGDHHYHDYDIMTIFMIMMTFVVMIIIPAIQGGDLTYVMF